MNLSQTEPHNKKVNPPAFKIAVGVYFVSVGIAIGVTVSFIYNLIF